MSEEFGQETHETFLDIIKQHATREEQDDAARRRCEGDPERLERVVQLLAEHRAQSGDEDDGNESLVGQLIAGEYRVVQLLGEGGFGEVYLAEQKRPMRRRVALKVIRRGMDSKGVLARFESERQALALMDHAHIAKVFTGGTLPPPDARPYFVMEYVDGTPLTAYCLKRRLGLEERLRLFIDVCEAVQHAHQKAIIHRDLKPGNVLVSGDGAGSPKVIDFGIAKALSGQPLTDRTTDSRIGRFIGTPEYCAPEQFSAAGEEQDTRTDIYALGAMLYELLTGSRLFPKGQIHRANIAALERMVREVEPIRPSARVIKETTDLTPEVPQGRRVERAALAHRLRGDLDNIIGKCLHKDRTERYATALEVAKDIRRHLNNEPVLARPPSKWYAARKFVRRQRGAVAVAGIVLFALAMAAIVSIRFGIKERRASNDLRHTQTELRASLALSSARLVEDPSVAAMLVIEASSLVEQSSPPWPGVLAARRALSRPAPAIRIRNDSMKPVISPFGRRIAAVDAGELRIWRVESGAEEPIPEEARYPVSEVRFSSDGTWIATASESGIVRLWPVGADADGHDFVVLPHGGPVQDIAFSPDTKWLATGSKDRFVRLWTLAQLEVAADSEPTGKFEHESAVLTVSFSHDSEWVLAVTESNKECADLWHVATEKHAALCQNDGTEERVELSHAEFSADDNYILTVSRKGMFVWSIGAIGSDGNPGLEGRAGIGTVHHAQFLPGGNAVFTQEGDRHGYVWTPSLVMPRASTEGMFETEYSMNFSNDGAWRLTTGLSGVFIWWHAREYSFDLEFSFPSRDSYAFKWPLTYPRSYFGSAAFSENGDWVITPPEDGLLRVWRSDWGDPVVLPTDDFSLRTVWGLGGHVGTVPANGRPERWGERDSLHRPENPQFSRITEHARFSEDGSHVITLSSDGRARLWQTGERHLPDVIPQPVKEVAFLREGARLVTRSEGDVRLWQVDTMDSIPIPHRAAEHVIAARDVDRIATAAGNTAMVWNIDGLPESKPFDHDGRVLDISFLQGGRQVLTLASDGRARVWPFETSEKPIVVPHESVEHVASSAGGRRFATASKDGTVHVWRTDGTAVFDPKKQFESIRQIALSADGKKALALADVGRVWVWSVGENTGAPFDHGERRVNHAEFSRDGSRVVTASDDRTARVWQANGVGNPVVLNHQGPVRYASFSTDGKWVVTAWQGPSALMWRIDFELMVDHLKTRMTECLQPEERTRYHLARTPVEAYQGFANCERAHGRTPAEPGHQNAD